MEHKFYLGKCDYEKIGWEVNKAYLIWSLEDTDKGLVFSAQGEIWNSRETDTVCCGQCLEVVLSYFPDNEKAQRIVAIWKRWHLNDMRAGTPEQTAWLRENLKPEDYDYAKSYYEVACEKLAEAGLNPDNGYEYGSAWFFEPLPPEVIAEIQSWSE